MFQDRIGSQRRVVEQDVDVTLHALKWIRKPVGTASGSGHDESDSFRGRLAAEGQGKPVPGAFLVRQRCRLPLTGECNRQDRLVPVLPGLTAAARTDQGRLR